MIRSPLFHVLGGALLAIAILLYGAWPSSRQAHAEDAPGICSGDMLCLDQGWSEHERLWWYSVSQGSRLMPLRWFLALEDPASPPEKPEPFLSANNVQRWGYLPAP